MHRSELTVFYIFSPGLSIPNEKLRDNQKTSSNIIKGDLITYCTRIQIYYNVVTFKSVN